VKKPNKFSSTGTPAERNIKVVCDLEKRALNDRTVGERVSDFIAFQAGKMWFIMLHMVWFVAWVAWNSVPGVYRFDPFPYSALTTAVSLEAIFLSLFILMSQNRMNRRADERSQLDLQINLLAEHETTKMLQLLRALCIYHKLAEAEDPEVAQLLRQTEPAELARELAQQLPSEQ